MNKHWRRGASLVLASALCAAVLSGCSKEAEAEPVYTFNGEEVDADLTVFLLRYEQAEIDESYGSMFSSYYGQSMWTLDLSGTGEVYETTYKTEFGEMLEQLLLCEEHADEYNAALTDDEKAAISEAASQFISDNDEETLSAMKASQEVVEHALQLFTIQSKAEKAMSADVDTEVSDEEAAQRTVSYIEYTPVTEAASDETETEADVDQTEADSDQTEAETAVTAEALTEGETSPAVSETEEADLTGSSDETESLTEAEAAEETETAAETEEETETEDPALTEAKIKYHAMAQEQLDSILDGDVDYDTAYEEIDEADETGVYVGSFTFGKDDTYPAEEIIEATDDLDDGTVVDHLVESNSSWYILRVDDAFDEEATEEEKESIIDERRQDMVDAVYDAWMEDETWEVNEEALAAISLSSVTYQAPETTASDETEAAVETEADISSGETETESGPGVTDAGTEAENATAAGGQEAAAQTESEA